MYQKAKTEMKTTRGHVVVGFTFIFDDKDREYHKECNVLKHKDGKYFAAGGARTGYYSYMPLFDEALDAATWYHNKNKKVKSESEGEKWLSWPGSFSEIHDLGVNK